MDPKKQKTGDNKVVKSNKKQIKHDPQAESARTVFGREKEK